MFANSNTRQRPGLRLGPDQDEGQEKDHTRAETNQD